MVAVKETQYNRIRVLQDGQINAYLNRCVVDDGIATLIDYFKIEVTPIQDMDATLAQADVVLFAEGFGGVPVQAVDGMRSLYPIEHTAGAKIAFQVASARLELSGLPTAERRIFLEEFIADNSPPPAPGVVINVCLSLVDILSKGEAEVRLRKCVFIEGEIANAPQYHRLIITPGMNATTTMNAMAALSLRMGWGPISVADIDRVARICTVFHTPDVVLAFTASRER